MTTPDNISKLESYLEEKFYDIITNFELYSMIQEIHVQKIIYTKHSFRRVDFVLIIDSTPGMEKGLYIEIDGYQHQKPEQILKDRLREKEIFRTYFPMMRFTGDQVLYQPGYVANVVEGKIEEIKGA